MRTYYSQLTLFCAILFNLLTFSKAESYPWGGLVLDNDGNIYFTFICPFVDDDHYACVWKIDSNNNLNEVLKASQSPSDIILKRTLDRTIFAAERNGSNPNYLNSLWKINEEESNLIIEPSTNQNLFHIQTYAVTAEGIIYFAKDHKLFKRDANETISEIELEDKIGRIQLLEIGPSNSLYIFSENNLYKRVNNTIDLIVEGLREENPENVPFQGANIMFDMAVDENGNAYFAYYGNRKVLRVSHSGSVSEILTSKAPWSPHGIDILNDEIYVLESTLGDGKWWEFWKRNDNEIIPRIRKVSTSGKISEVFSFTSN